ncbi:SpoIIE family protein phosphatase, partial [bacterium]|nr:SpoIIE family protein phosphatase [bacterium]
SSAARQTDDSTFVFRRVDSLDFVAPPIPSVADTIISINDSAATRTRWTGYFNSPNPPWQVTPVEYIHNGQTLRTEIRTHPPSYREFFQVLVLQVLRFLISFLFTAVGLWAFFRRPSSAGVRALALFSFAMAGFMISSVRILPDQYAAFQIPLDNIAQNFFDFFSSFFSAFFLNLVFLFPRPSRLMLKRPVVAYSICYLPLILLSIYVLLTLITSLEIQISIWLLSVLGLQTLAALVLLIVRYKRTHERLEKRQMRMVLWGSGTGLGLLFLLLFLLIAVRGWFTADPQRSMILINASFLGLLLTPITFAYAFGHYRLLEVEASLRRGTRYVIAIGLILALTMGIGFSLGTLLKNYLEGGGNLAIFTAGLTALFVILAARKAETVLKGRFYPERQRLRQMILDFLQQTTTLPDKQSFWSQLESRLQSGLMIEGVFPAMRSPEHERFLLRDSDPLPFRGESDFVNRLQHEQRAMMVDEALAGQVVQFTLEETTWLKTHRVALILPLITRGQLIGFVGLGTKIQKEDYVAEELRILNTLAPQVAVASENIRLLEENVGKRRLEEQLQMARRIQNGFLPHELPLTPGLAVAARNRFCLEVAGDYYDVIPLENGETVLAVADVSGKGAGAALLMANLQASLRTAVGVGTQLAGIVARINDLIHRNTPTEEYITFFAGAFNPNTREFTYVNAGHNPPFLLRRDGSIKCLDKGGLILGTIPGIPYQQETIKLESGELILMYTDGVSEAMNNAEEEFGDERIAKLLQENATLSPEALLAKLEADVIGFNGSDDFEDDFTLLAARIEEK